MQKKLFDLLSSYPNSYACVTGSNGKSSVLNLANQMLVKSGKKVFLGGGSFKKLEEIETEKSDLALIEAGSANLESSALLHPAVSVITNIAIHHAERHGSFEKYKEAKKKVFQGQDANDYLIYNATQDVVCEMVKEAKAQKIAIYSTHPIKKNPYFDLPNYAYFDQNKLILQLEAWNREEYPRGPYMQGEFQVLNALCALTLARLMGASYQTIVEVLQEYKGLPQRLYLCASKEGRHFYDDSRSLNLHSTAWALASFKEKVILIMGGANIFADTASLSKLIQQKVKLLILVNRSRRAMYAALKDSCEEIYLVETLEDALSLAWKMSYAGDNIVYSPGVSLETKEASSYEELALKYFNQIEALTRASS